MVKTSKTQRKQKKTEGKHGENKEKTKWVASHKRFSLTPFSQASYFKGLYFYDTMEENTTRTYFWLTSFHENIYIVSIGMNTSIQGRPLFHQCSPSQSLLFLKTFG